MSWWISELGSLGSLGSTITLEFTADGGCSVAVHGGSSSRAEMSYRPQTPGRCAVPAVREQGPVSLTVLLPPGSERPRASTPELAWAVHDGRAVGTATLAAAPEYVDIMPAGSGVPAIYGWLLLAIAALSLVWGLRITDRIAKARRAREGREVK